MKLENMSNCCSPSNSKSTISLNTEKSIPNCCYISSNNDMIYLSGGEFLMGTDDPEGYIADGEGPL